jgi:hypothetical protein
LALLDLRVSYLKDDPGFKGNLLTGCTDHPVFEEIMKESERLVIDTGRNTAHREEISGIILAGKEEGAEMVCTPSFAPFTPDHRQIDRLDFWFAFHPVLPPVTGDIGRIRDFQHDSLVPLPKCRMIEFQQLVGI